MELHAKHGLAQVIALVITKLALTLAYKFTLYYEKRHLAVDMPMILIKILTSLKFFLDQ